VQQNGFEVVRIIGDVLVPIADEWTRPWAAVEERVLKRLGKMVVRFNTNDRVFTPWFELYCRRIG
jgi:hypothetical protein